MQVLTWLGCHLQCITRGREPPSSLLACSLTIPFPHPNTPILICTSQAGSTVTKELCRQQFPCGGMDDQPPAPASWLPTDGYPAQAWPPECHCLCVRCLYLGNHLPGEW